MKNKGIVRRLDSLGRIVIPREFRKLHKIALGDPLEITTLESGEIILRKVDLTAEFATAAAPALEQLNLYSGSLVMAADAETYISGAGANRLNYIGTQLPGKLKALIEGRKSFVGLASECGMISPDYLAVMPVTGEMDNFGAFIMLSPQSIGRETADTLRVVAAVVGKSLQKF